MPLTAEIVAPVAGRPVPVRTVPTVIAPAGAAMLVRLVLPLVALPAMLTVTVVPERVEVAFAERWIWLVLSTLAIVVPAGMPVPVISIPATMTPLVLGEMLVMISLAFVVLPVAVAAGVAGSVMTTPDFVDRSAAAIVGLDVRAVRGAGTE